MRRAQDIAERHAGQRHIVHIPPAAPDQPRILEAGYGLTDSEFLHRTSPLKRVAFARLRGRMLKGAGIKSKGLSCKSFWQTDEACSGKPLPRHSGARPQAESPESIATGQGVWIPGSPPLRCGAPE